MTTQFDIGTNESKENKSDLLLLKNAVVGITEEIRKSLDKVDDSKATINGLLAALEAIVNRI